MLRLEILLILMISRVANCSDLSHASRPLRQRAERGRKAWIAAAVLVAAGGGACSSKTQPAAPAPRQVESRPVSKSYQPPVNEAGFLGLQACAECHAGRVAEFKHTRHFLACSRPEDRTMPAGFAPGRGVFQTHLPSLRFEMTQRGDEFFQATVSETAEGEKRGASSRIDLVYGAAPNDEVYFTWRGDKLCELPIVWLHSLQTWGAHSFDPHGAGDYSREATVRCLECHNTWFKHVPGSLNQYRPESLMLGVTCERCHGPGQEHVALHRNVPQAVEDERIVRPSLLSRERQMDLCAQCHSNAIHHRRTPLSYRPGEPLDDYFKTLTSRYPEDDHVANQVKYLRESRCYLESENLACVTCHNPHRLESHEPAARAATCKQCHKAGDCGEHSRLPDAVRDNCVSCHMPVRNKYQVNFHTQTDGYYPPVKRWEHRIAIYPEARDEVLWEWRRTQHDEESRREAERLSAALTRHWLEKGESRLREHRLLAAIDACREAARFDSSAQARERLDQLIAMRRQADAEWYEANRLMNEGRQSDAIAAFEELLSIDPGRADVHGKLGTLYAMTGNPDLAKTHLDSVARLDPNSPYGLSMLGWMAFLEGRADDAVNYYQAADEIEPRNPKIHHHWGLSLLKLGRWSQADDHFQVVLSIDPYHAGALHARAHCLHHEGKTKDALQCAMRAAELTSYEDADVLLTLADLFAAENRWAEAAAAAAQAVSAAEGKNAELAAMARTRLKQYQAKSMLPDE